MFANSSNLYLTHILPKIVNKQQNGQTQRSYLCLAQALEEVLMSTKLAKSWQQLERREAGGLWMIHKLISF